jgi:hypothetical protein
MESGREISIVPLIAAASSSTIAPSRNKVALLLSAGEVFVASSARASMGMKMFIKTPFLPW